MKLRTLIRMDGLAALASGCAVLLVRPWIAEWSGLPADTLVSMAAISLVYAAYSLTLSMRAVIPIFGVKALIAANLVWAVVCIGVLAGHSQTATVLGCAYLLIEALLVAALAWLERRELSSLPPIGR